MVTHLELPTDFPVFKPAKALPATNECGPPDGNCQLELREDLYEENSQAADDPPTPDFLSAGPPGAGRAPQNVFHACAVNSRFFGTISGLTDFPGEVPTFYGKINVAIATG